ncbi:ubiquitin carboxyl-terminal hydrolase 48-like [Chaetodon trifascialis]|uniref:ubiquitin carboxyl-terminal hydrolase 48-like n=1 Tax=Chaetodon trifascialis TaxID=109706 RepID=UPI0039940D9B
MPRKSSVKYGLSNQGATCYLNSVLQVLFMTEDFRAAVERDKADTDCIDRHLATLFGVLKERTADTRGITGTLGINSVYEQQDAAEYFERILSLASPEASQIFRGLLTHRTTCCTCRAENETDGAFWHLPLALVDSCSEHYSVVDGVEEYFRASDFSGENQMYCEQCDAKSDATVECVMKRHPEVLMLLLKRFDFDYRYMTYVKINHTVNVPSTLQIPENQTYELYAVVDHFGDLRSGHYTAAVKDEERWYNFNDHRVTLLDDYSVDNFQR